MSNEELKPCPFCGRALDAQWNRPNPKARCITEGCKGGKLPVINLDQPDDIEAWNRRAAIAPSDAAQAPICWITREQLGQIEDLTADAWVYWRETGHVAEDDEVALYAHPVAPQAAGDAAQALEGWRLVRVNEHFDALISALERAESKGYLPDAMAEEWANFACDENVTVPPAAAAPLSGWKFERHHTGWIAVEPNGRCHIAFDRPECEETERVLARLCAILSAHLVTRSQEQS